MTPPARSAWPRETVDQFLDLVDRLGEALLTEEATSGATFMHAASRLPAKHDVVFQALCAISALLADPAGRRWIRANYPRRMANHLLLQDFTNSVQTGALLLAKFLPDEEAALVNRYLRETSRDPTTTAFGEFDGRRAVMMMARSNAEGLRLLASLQAFVESYKAGSPSSER